MRKVVFLFAACAALWASAQKESPARQLVTLLTEMKAREEVTPDSFYSDVRLLRDVISEQQDSASKAVYRASLARLLSQNMWRAQTTRRATASHPDSLQEWSREEYVQSVTALYREALCDKEQLQRARTRDWLPLVRQGRDEAVFGGGMLSVVWTALLEDLPDYRRNKEKFCTYAAMADFYNRHDLREAALRTLLDSLQYNRTSETLKAAYQQLCEEYADIPACALAYLQLAQHEVNTANDRNPAAQWADSTLQEVLRLARLCHLLRQRAVLLRRRTLPSHLRHQRVRRERHDRLDRKVRVVR